MMATQPGVKKYDAVIIGSGQSGTPLASALAQSGRTTALIEKAHVGGCCMYGIATTPTRCHFVDCGTAMRAALLQRR